MDKVQAFDIPVDDMERAKRFYEKVFGWEIAPVPGSGGDFYAATTRAQKMSNNCNSFLSAKQM